MQLVKEASLQFCFSMVNLVVVKLGQSTRKAPKKEGPPKETEKPESDWY